MLINNILHFLQDSLKANWMADEDDDNQSDDEISLAIEGHVHDDNIEQVKEGLIARSVQLKREMEESATEAETSAAASNFFASANRYRPENVSHSLVSKATPPTPASSSDLLRVHAQAILDDRIQGDYSAWQSGPRLTTEGLRSAYSGLVDVALDTGRFISILAIECVLRPDISASKVLEAMTKVTKTSRMNVPGGGSGSLRFTNRQENHLVVEVVPKQESRVTAALVSGLANESDQQDEDAEASDWDKLDIQLCLSRELRQRVLLCQFLKKVSVDETDNAKPVNDRRSSSALQSALLSESNTLSPATRRLARVMQRALTQNQFSFSCLYMVDADTVATCDGPEGLDPQFTAQLELMFKENMMLGLRDFFDDIEEKTEQVVKETELMKSILRYHIKVYRF